MWTGIHHTGLDIHLLILLRARSIHACFLCFHKSRLTSRSPSTRDHRLWSLCLVIRFTASSKNFFRAKTCKKRSKKLAQLLQKLDISNKPANKRPTHGQHEDSQRQKPSSNPITTRGAPKKSASFWKKQVSPTTARTTSTVLTS